MNQIFKGLEGADIKIAMLHHPHSYLREFDGEEIWDSLRSECALILRGHLHKEKSMITEDNQNRCLEIAVGAVYHDSSYPNAFHLVELYPESMEVKIHARLWKGRNWIIDRNLFQGEVGCSCPRLKVQYF